MGPVETVIVLVFLAIPVIFGIGTMMIAAGKGRDTGGEKLGWFLLGLCFPLIGLIIALIIGPKQRVI